MSSAIPQRPAARSGRSIRSGNPPRAGSPVRAGNPARAGNLTRPGVPARTAEDPRLFAVRVKRWALGFTVAAFAAGWGLVSVNSVGATNATPPAGSASTGTTPGRATIPSADFFGQPPSQAQPFIGNGGQVGGAPIVRGRTS
jgi:hypothetical protein